MIEEFIRQIGVENTLKVCLEFGGCFIYFPKKEINETKPDTDIAALIDIIGRDSVDKLLELYKGEQVHIYQASSMLPYTISAEHDGKSESTKRIAKKYGVSRSHIYKLLNERRTPPTIESFLEG